MIKVFQADLCPLESGQLKLPENGTQYSVSQSKEKAKKTGIKQITIKVQFRNSLPPIQYGSKRATI